MSVDAKEYEGLGLTPEEIASLQEDDGDTSATQEELEAQAAAAGGAPAAAAATKTEEGDDDDDDQAPASATTAASADGSAAAPAAAAAEPAEAAAEPAPAPQPAPLLVAEAPADAEAKLKEISDQRAALRKQYDAGELTFDQYDGQKDTLAKQERDIERAIDRAQIATDLTDQQRRNEWVRQCDAFHEAHPEYEGGKGDRFTQLNGILKAIAVVPENAGKTGPELLNMAHTMALVMRGENVPAAASATPKPAARAPVPKPALPPDLGKMPSAGGNDAGEGKWSSLDRMQTTDPVAYEKALSQLSERDREAYLAD